MTSSSNPTVAALIIGAEVLSGRVADVNLNYLARRCTDVGLDLKEARVVPDDVPTIVSAINALRATYTYVFTTGGIGPTHDDVTIAAVAQAFGVAVVRNPEVETRLTNHYSTRLNGTSLTSALRMADYPAGSRVVWHGENFAPGCIMDNVVVLAGQPRIMQVMFEAALPQLNTGTPLHMRQVDAWVMESQIAEGLGLIQTQFPTVEIGSYPYRVDGRPGTALVARGANQAQVEEAFAALHTLLHTANATLRALG